MLIVSPAISFAAKVLDIDVIGNRNVTRDNVLNEVQNLKVNKEFASEDAVADRERIEALGLFQDVSYEVRESTDGVVVIFRVVENPIVASITIEGNEHVPRSELDKSLETKVGNIVNFNSLREDADRIIKTYREKGYLADIADVRFPGGDVAFTVVEIKVNTIVIKNVAQARKMKTRQLTILREIHLKKGDLYDLNKLRRDINRLRDLDIFEEVGFDPRVDENTPPGTADILIQVKERRTAQLLFGIASTFRNEFVGYLSLREANWRGKAESLAVLTEVGDRQTYELNYLNPWFDKKHTSFHFTGGDRQFFRDPRGILGTAISTTTERDFLERRKGASFGFTRPRDDREEVFYTVAYRFEDVSFIQRDPFIAGQVISTSFGTVSAPSFGVVLDKRDSRIDPNRGHRGSIGVEIATSILGSGSSFQKLDLDVRKYLPVGRKRIDEEHYRDIVAGRFVFGKVFGSVPVFEQYFVGGSDSIRGYDIDRAFGENQIVANLELRHRVQKNLTVVGFVDWGDSWGGPFSNSQRFESLFGKGMGVRIRTPFGPLRLDYGIGDRNRLHFSIGHPF